MFIYSSEYTERVDFKKLNREIRRLKELRDFKAKELNELSIMLRNKRNELVEAREFLKNKHNDDNLKEKHR